MKMSLPTGEPAATRSISSPRSLSARASRSPTDKQEFGGACAGAITPFRFRYGAAGSAPPARRRGRFAAMDQAAAHPACQPSAGRPEWLHEIKFDGYRMHARLDRGVVRLLTRTGLDWTHKYPAIAAAMASIGARQVYLDGELC